MKNNDLRSFIERKGNMRVGKITEFMLSSAIYCKGIILAVLLLTTFHLTAQVSFSGSYYENFNTFSAGTAPLGWSYTGTFRGTGSGTSNTGGAWCYGSGSDWSMGLLHSGSAGIISITGSFTNATTTTITALTISYNFEQWRYANTSGLIATSAGALAGSSAAIQAALSGSGSASGSSGSVTTTPKTVSLTGLSIAPGATYSITWTVDDPGGADNGISVDDFRMCIPNASFPVVAANTSPVPAGTSFALSSTPTGTYTPFTYSWTGPAGSGFTSATQNPVIPGASVSAAYGGIYSVVVTDANNCTALATTTATVTTTSCTVPPTAVSATASSTALCSGATLTLTGTATDGASYSWTGPNSYASPFLNPPAIITATASAGIYTLVATNACGSTTVTTASVTVTAPPSALLATASATTLCAGNTLTLLGAASGATSYGWAGPGGYSAAVINPPSFVVSTASSGIYTFTATNSCGSANTNTGTITVNTIPATVTASASSSSICVGNTLTLTGAATGATSYSWAGPDGYTAAVLNPAGIVTTLSSGGVYTLTATNSCGSTTATTVSVVITTAPTAVTATLSATSLCAGDALTLSGAATGATSYSWAGPGGYAAAVLNPPVITTTSLSAGIYTLTATNVCGNTTAVTGALTINTVPTAVTATANPTTLCSGDVLTLTGSATSPIAMTYSWAGSGSYASVLLNPPAIITTTLSAGVYTLTATNICGNTVAMTASVTINTVPTAVTATPNVTALCSGDVLTLTGTATSPITTTYAWAGPDSYASTDLSPAGITTSTLSGGVYTLVATNVCGSTTAMTPSITINTVPSAVTATASATTLCAGNALTLAGTSTSPITAMYLWNGPGGYSSVNLNPPAITTTTLSSGIYTLTATNVCGSIDAITALVTVNEVPQGVTATPSATTLCSGATLTLTGTATSPLTTSYSWAGPDGFTSTDLNPAAILTTTLSAGVYTLTATNSCGNAIATTPTIIIRTVPTAVTATASPTTLCSGNTLSLTGTATSPIITSYSWSGPNSYSSAVLNPAPITTTTLSSGVYTLTATNICGSTVATAASVTVNTVPGSVTATASSASLCEGAGLTLTGTATSPLSTTYSWAGPNGYSAPVLNPTGFTTTSLSAGIYTLTATNLCGNATANTGVITIISVPTSVSASSVTSSLCTGASLTLVGAASGATVYSWSGPGGYSAGLLNPPSFITTSTSSGIYTLTAGNSCFTVTATTAVVLVPLPPMAAITGITTICQGSTSSLLDTVSGGVWSTSDPSIATVDGAGLALGINTGTATISYTNTNSCGTALATTTITVIPVPAPTPVTGSSIFCLGSATVFSNAIAGGTWVSSNTAVVAIDASGIATGMGAGSAVISYTVNNGCGAPVTDTLAISVITAPDAGNIFGAVRVCMSDTIRLYNYTAGGTWYVTNGRATIAATDGLVTGSAPGLDTAYYVVTNMCGTDTTRYTFYIYTAMECATAMGVGSVSANNFSCTIYPNPNTGTFTLTGSWIAGDNTATIEVIDLLGQVVYTKNITISNGKIDEEVQLGSNLSSGMYMLRINSANANQAIRFTISQ